MTALPLRERLGLNPLWVKGLRSRCRLKHLLSWGAIWLTLATFVFLIVDLTVIEQSGVSKANAAKAALTGILIVQAIILMFFGTGAVASGVAQERDESLLDYVRMTPMSPTAKILGYLFGLPAREYVLVGLTMPLVAIAVLLGGFSLLTLAHFYLVFFSSVLVYHMTALVVGMVALKPRFASIASMGLVVLLYFVLPNLSRLGITFFEFLTIRPTFLGLIQQELPEHIRAQAEASGIDTFRPVPFFGGSVRPTVYTMLVQGFMLAVLFSVAHRRWRDQASHLFSKAGAALAFVGVGVFAVGSLWAVVVQDDTYHRLFDPAGRLAGYGRVPETFMVLFIICMMILGAAYLFLIYATTASRDKTLAGLRRARRLGRARTGLNSDAASSLPLALVMLGLAIGAGIAIVAAAASHGGYIASGPSFGSAAVVLLAVAGVALFIQGLAESTSTRIFGVALFLLWMIPFFTMIILMSAFEAFEGALYVGQPCPPVSLGFAVSWMLETTAPLAGHEDDYRFVPETLRDAAPAIAGTGAAIYAGGAVLAQIARWKRRRRLTAMK